MTYFPPFPYSYYSTFMCEGVRVMMLVVGGVDNDDDDDCDDVVDDDDDGYDHKDGNI
ncbi:hypothetical protein DFA_01020 [Cavenderia fasciculata]|uniref:Uncharacterized protein n=1 Tax=Cavenderia fasciculata TaxID=261658 RepID=F4PV29_CACFS|nr:uncharacterized protein DFA_01020 [Cavenderia fasciculata]EGG21145.1 hypothetical protein DFA_01020 [Cavenderia fasciculata]|eukprot:XP_004358995.1 hypothetical protein DFA_01020 [Cavenderia fasciculata]